MGNIRSFVAQDIPQVARLHHEVFKTGSRLNASWLNEYRGYFTNVFLEGPTADPSLPSLVFEEDDGTIAGFLGVVPRQMTMKGRRIQAAISSQFIVAPATRSGLVAVRLARAFLEGPQDLSISDEANDISRKIWEGLGGVTALWHSLYWTRPLRPARLVLSMLRARAPAAPIAIAAAPFAPLIDAIATRMPQSPLRQSRPEVDGEDLTERTILSYVSRCMPASLRMDYDPATLSWVMALARRRKRTGSLQAIVVRRGDRIIGWYVYHLDAERIANVLQLAAEGPGLAEVVDHLFYQAGANGANAVCGRVDPRHLQALTDRHCVLHRRGPWVLLSSMHAEILRAFETGDVCLSRLDGEWSLGF